MDTRYYTKCVYADSMLRDFPEGANNLSLLVVRRFASLASQTSQTGCRRKAAHLTRNFHSHMGNAKNAQNIGRTQIRRYDTGKQYLYAGLVVCVPNFLSIQFTECSRQYSRYSCFSIGMSWHVRYCWRVFFYILHSVAGSATVDFRLAFGRIQITFDPIRPKPIPFELAATGGELERIADKPDDIAFVRQRCEQHKHNHSHWRRPPLNTSIRKATDVRCHRSAYVRRASILSVYISLPPSGSAHVPFFNLPFTACRHRRHPPPASKHNQRKRSRCCVQQRQG